MKAFGKKQKPSDRSEPIDKSVFNESVYSDEQIFKYSSTLPWKDIYFNLPQQISCQSRNAFNSYLKVGQVTEFKVKNTISQNIEWFQTLMMNQGLKYVQVETTKDTLRIINHIQGSSLQAIFFIGFNYIGNLSRINKLKEEGIKHLQLQLPKNDENIFNLIYDDNLPFVIGLWVLKMQNDQNTNKIS